MKKLLPLLLLFLLRPFGLSAQSMYPMKDILLICSHAESSDWAQEMIKPVYLLEKERDDIRVFYNFLHATSLSGTEELEARKRELLDAFGSKRPALVVIIGGSGYIVAKDVDAKWPGVPMILAGENDFFCEDYYTIRGGVDPKRVRTPVSSLLESGLNITLLQTPAMVEQTVELMCDLLPEMDKILYIAGENFQSREQQLRLERYLTSIHAHLGYEVISSTTTTTDQLISRLQAEDRRKTGVIYGSWLVHEGYMQNVSSRNNIVHIVETIIPIFMCYGCDFDKNQQVVGYVSYDHERYYMALRSAVLSVIDKGIQPGKIPFVRFGPMPPTVNWAAMNHFNLDTGLIPEGAIVKKKPQAFWDAYGNLFLMILSLAALMVLLTIFVYQRRTINAKKEAILAIEKANNIKTAFIQNMTHEIRTPLHAIAGFAQLLCLPDGYNSEDEKAEYLTFITNNTHLLTMLVNDIISLSDEENGEFRVNLDRCYINAVCQLAMKSVDYRRPNSVQLRFNTAIPDDLYVISDAMRAQQVLLNYLTNACKYTDEGFVDLEVSLDENPGYVTMSVTDTGPGVPPGKEEEIFGRFVKLDQHKQGVGLGLNISRMLAEKLGGKAFLDTSHRPGSRFVFILPYNPPEDLVYAQDQHEQS